MPVPARHAEGLTGAHAVPGPCFTDAAYRGCSGSGGSFSRRADFVSSTAFSSLPRPLDRRSARATPRITGSNRGWKENVGAPASLGAGDASTPLTSSPCPLCAAVVHERGELLHRPVERHGHARPLLFHRRNCVPVSGLFLSWCQVALASLGRRGEGKIPDVQAQISLCPAPQGLSQKATSSASWRHSMPAKSCFRSSPPGALSLKRDPQCFTLLTELGAGSLGSEEAGER